MQPCPARPQTCSATSRSPSPNPHTRRPSCSFRYWSGGGGRCTETCDWKSDGFCDDGGSGAEYSLCSIGTDCADCSRRPPPPPLAVNLNQPCTRTGFICPGDHHGTTSYCQGWASNSVCYSGSCMTPYNCSPDRLRQTMMWQTRPPPPPQPHPPPPASELVVDGLDQPHWLMWQTRPPPPPQPHPPPPASMWQTRTPPPPQPHPPPPASEHQPHWLMWQIVLMWLMVCVCLPAVCHRDVVNVVCFVACMGSVHIAVLWVGSTAIGVALLQGVVTLGQSLVFALVFVLILSVFGSHLERRAGTSGCEQAQSSSPAPQPHPILARAPAPVPPPPPGKPLGLSRVSGLISLRKQLWARLPSPVLPVLPAPQRLPSPVFKGGTKLLGLRAKLYHQTDQETADIIMATQHMKPGFSGLAGGGIYFATTPELTHHKAHRHGVILEATVALGGIHILDAAGDSSMTLQRLKSLGCNSVCISRPVSSGLEYVVYDPKQVLSIKRVNGRYEC